MKVIMGLECHVQLNTKTKLFCSCLADSEGKQPNENTCPICLGFPGSKPMINKKTIDSAILVALALNCRINSEMFLSRKSYFYPDMSKNFQITQYEVPLAQNGYLQVGEKKIRIKRIQIEEDPARLIHVGGDITTAQYVLIDYNRSGTPLIELVTEPDFESTTEIREFLSKLSSILEHLEVFDPNKEGSLRVDSNISIEGGERVEVKNITGFANVEKALNYEIARQESLRRMGMKVERETRHFDAQTKMTHTLRKKEVEEEYGYIFEPDLTKIEISDDWINELKSKMPELPDARAKRFMKEYDLIEHQAKVLVYTDKALADFFEESVKIYNKPKEVAKWMTTDLLKSLNYQGIAIRESKVRPNTFIELLELIDSKAITERLAKEIIKEYVETGESPKSIVEKKGIKVISKSEELDKVVDEVIKENKKAVIDYKSGNEKAIEFLIGQVLRKTKMAADPKILKKLIEEKI